MAKEEIEKEKTSQELVKELQDHLKNNPEIKEVHFNHKKGWILWAHATHPNTVPVEEVHEMKELPQFSEKKEVVEESTEGQEGAEAKAKPAKTKKK